MKPSRSKRASKRRRAQQPAIEVLVQSPLWVSNPDAKTVLRRAIRKASSVVCTGGELAIVLADDSTVRTLNRTWRDKDAPTNVLSFPVEGVPTGHGTRRLLGDIVIAYETTAREAQAQGKSFADHLVHLAVHGFLHLAGYDHVHDDEAETMERLESAILAELAVVNPHAAPRPHPAPPRRNRGRPDLRRGRVRVGV
jgi:probable rRNA maturation factor